MLGTKAAGPWSGMFDSFQGETVEEARILIEVVRVIQAEAGREAGNQS
jgi:hypothetical protein